VKRQQLVEHVRAAFPAEPIRGRAAFAQWGGTYLDARDYARAIDGKTWEQLDLDYIVRRHDALGFLSTCELVQLLSVYLLSIANEGVMSPALDSVLVELTRPARDPARFDAFVQALSAAQRDAIANTLAYIADEDPDGSPGRAAREARGLLFESVNSRSRGVSKSER
jgi:hypothetical protein